MTTTEDMTHTSTRIAHVLAYADYLAWMRHFTALSWPGRQDPLAEGETIELAPINGESIARHTFGLQTAQEGAD